MGEYLFFAWLKKKVPKERPPCLVSLRLLCALQLRAGAAELAIAQTVLTLVRSNLPVLEHKRGVAVKRGCSQNLAGGT